MACGVPVAAYPVTIPVDVIDNGRTGILDEDLDVAVQSALTLNRADCIETAQRFTWERCTRQFESHLAFGAAE